MKTLGMMIARIVALLALAALSWATALYFDWPLWSSPAVFCAALAGWLLGAIARRALRAVRARRQLARLDATERAPADRDAPELRVAARWRAALDALERAAPAPGLRGRPRDALPWYLVIGRTGAGKTTALARARIASPLRRARHDAAIAPTEDCDWWCFDDAVVLDLAGRFAEPDATDGDRRAWSALLEQLGRARARRGVNGVVVAIDAPRLVEADRDALTIDGCAVRERLEQLIRLFDRRFPVYVLVTQCDRLYGFDEWAAQLAPEQRDRAFGYLGDHDADAFVTHALDSIDARLAALRVAPAARGEPPSPRALMLPHELARVRPALDAFARAAFGPNVYQETPYLRGLLFASGRQAGGAPSLTLPDWLDAAPARAPGDAGLFLHDVFARVLPGERDAWRPVERPSRSRLTPARVALAAWLFACVAAGLLMSASFVGDMRTVELIRRDYPAHPRFTGELARDAATLERIGRVIADVERRDERRLVRRLAPPIADATPVGRLEAELKRRYVAHYRRSIEPAADRLFFGEPDGASDARAADDGDVAARIRNLVRYVNLMQARLRGADRETLARMPAPAAVRARDDDGAGGKRRTSDTSGTSGTRGVGGTSDTRDTNDASGARDRGDGLPPRIGALAVGRIAWSAPGDSALAARLAAAQAQLERLAYRDPDGAWLLALPDATMPRDVTLADFWPAAAPPAPPALPAAQPAALRDVRVPAALTAAHRPAIDAFLDEMAQAVANRPKFAFHRDAFDAWYRARRIDTWRDFVARFPQGEQGLTTQAQWRAVIDRIPDRRDPFSALLARVDREFESVRDDALPPWLRFVRTASHMLAPARLPAASGGLGATLGSISRSGGRALREALGGAPAQGRLTLERDAALRNALVDYERRVAALAADALAGPGAAYRLAADFHGFGVDPSVEASAMRAADDALRDVKRLAGGRDVGGDVVWSLVGGPLHAVIAYVERQASCALQDDWERDVLWPLRRAATHDDANDRLYGPQGAIWAFVDGPAKPFVRVGAARAAAADTLGYRLPFTDAFLPLVDDAAARRVAQARREAERRAQQQAAAELDERIASLGKQIDALNAQTVRIGIVAQPTDVNREAQAKPFETVLTLQCAPQARTLTNYNLRVSEQIDWQPDRCGDATLRIALGGVTLVRRYAGPLGVARFVQDFRYGVRRFAPGDFPDAKAQLERLGVRYVDVRYDFSGHDALLAHVERIDALERERRDDIARQRRAASRQDDGAGAGGSAANVARASSASSTPGAVDAALPRRIGACWGDPARDGPDGGGARP
ncbi:type VI secretion system protein [Burkholderia humptydooensis]|uniref:type VI secretion system protein n=1 Tax=Burkholderia humptydooensis TaxID=430531 RepID=UPI00039F9F0F|nr:type VI secretion system protein [Burkholderia humptydooensis]